MTPDLHDLELLLRSDTPIVLIESIEEPRVIDLFGRLAIRLSEPTFSWSVTDGLQRIEFDAPSQSLLADPTEVLRHLRLTNQRGIYLLLDFHPYLDNPLHVRLLKEIAQGYASLPRTLILVSHGLEIPAELRHLSARFSLRLPDRQRIQTLIREEAKRWRESTEDRPVHASREAVEQLAENLLGITESDARRLIRNAIRHDGAITQEDVQTVKRAKYELLSPEGVISFEHDTRSFADVAGLANLKAWVDRRRDAFLDPERQHDHPRGILLLGVQGGGKSLAAKAVAGRFGVPLLRLDFGVLYDKYIGETEKNLRKALETADLMAPCVLWIDEIEKGIATGSEDEGVGRRVLGTLPDLDGGALDPGVPDRHRQRHLAAAAGTDPQGPHRRAVLRRPALDRGPPRDFRHPPAPPRGRPQPSRSGCLGRGERGFHRRRDRTDGGLGPLRGHRPRRRPRNRNAAGRVGEYPAPFGRHGLTDPGAARLGARAHRAGAWPRRRPWPASAVTFGSRRIQRSVLASNLFRGQ